MNKLPGFVLSVAIGISSVTACYDVAGPKPGHLLAPSHARLSVSGPPDTTFRIYAASGSTIDPFHFLYPTWATLEGSGTINLTAKPLLPPGTQTYVQPGPVQITGKTDPRRGCALDVGIFYGGAKQSSFGACGVTPKIDTVKFDSSPTWKATRGTMPDDRIGDCSMTNTDCHSVNTEEYQTIRERPIQ